MDQADSTTPFIRNAWYVIAQSSEVTRVPMARTDHLGAHLGVQRVPAEGHADADSQPGQQAERKVAPDVRGGR